jgi:hypothetical protein
MRAQVQVLGRAGTGTEVLVVPDTAPPSYASDAHGAAARARLRSGGGGQLRRRAAVALAAAFPPEA